MLLCESVLRRFVSSKFFVLARFSGSFLSLFSILCISGIVLEIESEQIFKNMVATFATKVKVTYVVNAGKQSVHCNCNFDLVFAVVKGCGYDLEQDVAHTVWVAYGSWEACASRKHTSLTRRIVCTNRKA